MHKWNRVAVFALLSLLLLPAAQGCKEAQNNVVGNYTAATTAPPPVIIPYIPPAYYQSIEVLPVDLQNTYYTAYGNHAEAEVAYNDKVFVFRNLLVDQFMLRELDNGWIWVDLTKCPVVNIDYAETLKPGDRIDIVGICMGRDLKISPGLYFKDCYLVPAGCLQLPAPGGVGFEPIY